MRILFYALSFAFAYSTHAAAGFPGWWLHSNDKVGYELIQADSPTACEMIPGPAPIKGGPDLTDALKIEANGEMWDCSSNDPSRCYPYKDFQVDLITGKVVSTTLPNCNATVEILPSGNLKYSGICKGEYNEAELFPISEASYRKYVEVANKCFEKN